MPEATTSSPASVGRPPPMPPQDWKTITTKFTVGTYDLYLHVSWDQGGQPVHVDLFVSPSAVMYPAMGSVREEEYLVNQVAFLKSAIEVITRQASILLAAGTWTLDDLCKAWRGTHVYHGGLMMIDGASQLAGGPLDAAARLIEARMEGWQCRMQS